MPTWRRETILDIYNLVLGAFLFVAPWLFSYTRGVVKAEDWTSSALVIVMSAAALLAFAEWEEWANLVLGLWVLSAPFWLGFVHTTAMRVHVVLGIAITLMSAIELWLLHYDPVPPGSRD
ncbi:MAG TPA: SPW repeat protein [Xanthobacteraceae bacterium]